jgi:hypothetical protein
MAGRVACLAALWLVAFAAAAQPQGPPKPPPSPLLIERGTSVMANLKSGSFSPILDQMQHPPTYTEEEISDDRRAISIALQFLSSRFGKLESYELTQESVQCYWVSISMAPDDYWSQVAATELGAGVAFASRHAKLGSSVVRIMDSYSEGSGWIRSLDFGIPAATPGAKDIATRTARDMVSRMQAATRKPKPPAPPPPQPR